jgi:hypothetical protein
VCRSRALALTPALAADGLETLKLIREEVFSDTSDAAEVPEALPA